MKTKNATWSEQFQYISEEAESIPLTHIYMTAHSPVTVSKCIFLKHIDIYFFGKHVRCKC